MHNPLIIIIFFMCYSKGNMITCLSMLKGKKKKKDMLLHKSLHTPADRSVSTFLHMLLF